MLARVVKTGRFVLDVKRRMVAQKPDRPTAEWLRGRLQDMGPTYIKIGQFVASRRDIFDENVVDALRGLQDDVPSSMSREDTRDLIAARMGRHMKRIESVSPDPVACASIGQVHLGTTRSGKKIAIKIRRPGVIEDFTMDVAILSALLNVLAFLKLDNVPETKELLDDFRIWFIEEMDYTREVDNYKLLKANADPAGLQMPEFYERVCHADFIVMSFVPSTKFRDVTLPKAERRLLAIRLMDTFIGQLVVDGVMHGDPHEGNVGLGKDGRIVVYDMGNVIRLDATTRTRLKRLIFEIVTGNFDDAIDLMKKIDLFEVRDDAMVRVLLEKYAEYIRTVDVRVMQVDLTLKNDGLPIKFSGTVFRIVRVFGLLEGICKTLDAEFSYEPVFAKYMSLTSLNNGTMDTDYLRYKISSDLRKIAQMIIGT